MVINMKIGLALAGGGVKGAAHIGVLKALEEANIKLDYISGASSGSIVALLFSIGYTYDEILDIFKQYSKEIKYIDSKNLLKLISGLITKGKITVNGLNSGDKLEKIINKVSKNKGIENINQINFPLLIPAIDIHSGEVYYFSNKNNFKNSSEVKFINNANISKVVRASCSYPLVFSPCKYMGTELIDGGISENIPWKGLKQLGADRVISIVFDKKNNKKCCSNFIEVISNSLDIMSKELLDYELFGVDYIIQIKTENIGLLDMEKIDYLYNLGYEITKKKIKNILNKINNN